MRIHSFAPIINKECLILILGSMPGVKSLEKQEYYGNPQNKFWDVIYGVFRESPDTGYESKKQFLLNHGIALWDVIESCERKGSADSAIKDIKINDLPRLLKLYPGIRHIFFNGRTAENLFLKYTGIPGDRTTYLGSTSPANAIPLEDRISNWSVILPLLL